MQHRSRGIAQLVEQRSPKPRVESSSLSAPAKQTTRLGGLFFLLTAALRVLIYAGGMALTFRASARRYEKVDL